MVPQMDLVRMARVRRRLIKSRYRNGRKNRLGVTGKIYWRTACRRSV